LNVTTDGKVLRNALDAAVVADQDIDQALVRVEAGVAKKERRHARC